MQEHIMDMSGELETEFEDYVKSGSASVEGVEVICTMISCETLQCTGLGCC